jgi:hypothetical protein
MVDKYYEDDLNDILNALEYFSISDEKIDNFVVNELSTKNIGEECEIYTIKKLLELSQNNKIDIISKLFGKDAEDNITILNIINNNEIVDKKEVTKSTEKADLRLKLNKTNKILNISIKCMYGSPPAILNHTSRNANAFKPSRDLINELPNLDEIVKQMISLRSSGSCGEDIKINNLKLDDNLKKSFINTLKYFIFEGSGSKKSKVPANAILEIYNKNDINKWKFYPCESNNQKEEYINNIYDNLILSLRDKGMPTIVNDYCKPWIYNIKNKQKGALHIRIGKNKVI